MTDKKMESMKQLIEHIVASQETQVGVIGKLIDATEDLTKRVERMERSQRLHGVQRTGGVFPLVEKDRY